MKKLIALLFVELLSAISVAATETVNGVTYIYSISDGEAVVGDNTYSYHSAISRSTKGELQIPSSLGGYPISTIGIRSFYNCNLLTFVNIPESVATIGHGAFEGCSSLKAITIPNSVMTVESSAFYSCSGLRTVYVDKNDSVRVKELLYGKGVDVEVLSFVEKMPDGGPYKEIVEGVEYTFSIANGNATIGTGNSSAAISPLTSGDLVIPSILGGFPVTAIGDSAFSCCNSLTSVLIPECVTTIGARSFCQCKLLGSVIASSSVKVIGRGAFDETPFYEDQQDGMVVIGSVLYRMKGDCPSKVVIPEGVSMIVDSAFLDCSALMSVIIPSSVLIIGRDSFSECSSLRTVYTDTGDVERVKALMRENCVDVEALSFVEILPDEVHYKECVGGVEYTFSISNGVALIGTGTRSAAIPTSTSGDILVPSILGGCPVTSIGGCAFMDCCLLTSVTIPESVTMIGGTFYYTSDISGGINGGTPVRIQSNGFVFSCCDSLKSVSIPQSVTTIDKTAFQDCGLLKDVYVSSGDAVRVKDLMRAKGVDVEQLNFFVKAPEVGRFPDDGPYKINVNGIEYIFSILDGKAMIGAGGCGSSAITPTTFGMLDIPSKLGGCPVTAIGDYAFYNCALLTSVSIPNSVMKIGSAAFCGCRSLKSIAMPEGVMTIESSVFEGCGSLTSVTIPNSVISIGQKVFSNCKALASIKIPESVIMIGAYAFSNCSSLTSITIPNGVTTIESSVFEGCGSLTSVTIPNSVISIGQKVFSNCKALASIKIPESVITIGAYAFSNCSSLTSITIPNGVTTIGADTFRDCSSLIYVTIPNSVMTVDYFAFYGCYSLMSVTIPGHFSLPYIFPSAYEKIQTAVVVDGGTEIGREMFKGCRSLTYVTIPESVYRIGEYAFGECASLESVVLPSSITVIDDGVFKDCVSLREVQFCGDAPDVGMEIFKGTPKRVVVSVSNGSIGWSGGVSANLPETWEGRLIAHTGDAIEWPTIVAGSLSMRNSSVTVTNMVVHYVVNSVRPEFAKPVSRDTGFVNVIAEVNGNNVAVPQTWAENYPQFAAKFGSDFTRALTAKSSKIAAGGREMLVWEDYVAGTDPTDPNDKFMASMTIVDGKPVISWTPELDAERAAMRKYTIYGKAKLTDSEWSVVPEGRASDYNFFKVTVEMK